MDSNPLPLVKGENIRASGRLALRLARKQGGLLCSVMLAAGLLAGCNNGVYSNLDGSAGGEALAARADGNPPPDTTKVVLGKKQFREQNYGLAEKTFRGIVEARPENAEAWLGLAASYDQLGRFKLADRAYKQVVKLDGSSAVLHNNRGYSYLLRGDKRRARGEFAKARRLAPENQFVRNNQQLLRR